MTQRDRIVLAVLGAVAVLAGFWFLAMKPKREEAKAVEAQLTEQTQRRDDALAAVRAGEAARKGFAVDYSTVARLGKAVPVSDQVPSLVYQLDSAAGTTGVDFRSVKLRSDSVTPAAPPAAAAATEPPPPADGKAPAGSAPAGASGSQPAGASAPASVPTATQAAAAVAPPGSTVGPAGFPTMPFTFNFEGDFFDMERMLSQIERFTGTTGSGSEDVKVNGRLLTVDAFALIKSNLRPWPYVQAGIASTAYVLPPEEGAFDGATPAGPAGAPGATGTTATNPGAGQTTGPRPATAAVGGLGK